MLKTGVVTRPGPGNSDCDRSAVQRITGRDTKPGLGGSLGRGGAAGEATKLKVTTGCDTLNKCHKPELPEFYGVARGDCWLAGQPAGRPLIGWSALGKLNLLVLPAVTERHPGIQRDQAHKTRID